MREKLEKWKYFLQGNQTIEQWRDIKLRFYVSNSLDMFRARSVDKERDTIDWINSFDKDDIFWDVGANVGVYSLYAAKRIGCHVFAFEPVFHNFFSLNKNIILNGLSDRITAFCFSVHSDFKVANIRINNLDSGSAFSTFDNNNGNYIQGSVGISIDTLVKYLLFPNHIKIDVDGNEFLILDGMKKTMRDKRLKSIAVEIDKKGNMLFKYGDDCKNTKLG